MQMGLRIGEIEVRWLNGGTFELDGGAMFGVVPRVLWSKKYPCSADGHVLLVNEVMLVKSGRENIIIESGIGNKLTPKQKKIFRVVKEWNVPAELKSLGLGREDIHHVVLTHCDFDHAGGIVMNSESGKVELTFPRAVHHIQRLEWEDMLHPNSRSANSYWPVNFGPLLASPLLHLIDDREEISPGITVERSGGHTRGHQVVWMDAPSGEGALHLGDLLPSHAHINPLWVTPYDNFPLDSVMMKEKMLEAAAKQGRWLLLYHDPYMKACKWDGIKDITATWDGSLPCIEQ